MTKLETQYLASLARVLYPEDAAKFWQLVTLGGELRRLHLLDAPVVNDFITMYPVTGDNQVTRRLTKRSPGFVLTDKEEGLGRVWINDQQYFDAVSRLAAIQKWHGVLYRRHPTRAEGLQIPPRAGAELRRYPPHPKNPRRPGGDRAADGGG